MFKRNVLALAATAAALAAPATFAASGVDTDPHADWLKFERTAAEEASADEAKAPESADTGEAADTQG